MKALATQTLRKCFISYRHAVEDEVRQLIQAFGHGQDIPIAKGIGAITSGDIIDSANDDYVKSQIRTRYLRDTTVTSVLAGRETWRRKFVEREVTECLGNTSTATSNGLLVITLPSAVGRYAKQLPARVDDKVNGQDGYARWRKYRPSVSALVEPIEPAYEAGTSDAGLRDNACADWLCNS